jgi:hypothetical protein
MDEALFHQKLHDSQILTGMCQEVGTLCDSGGVEASGPAITTTPP